MLDHSLGDMIHLLNDKGRICVITFHSLEDRIVKNKFRENEKIHAPVPKNFRCVSAARSQRGESRTRESRSYRRRKN